MNASTICWTARALETEYMRENWKMGMPVPSWDSGSSSGSLRKSSTTTSVEGWSRCQ